MTIFLLGKILMSIATVMYGTIPLFADLNKTHATNPSWVSHARFHIVWQVLITFFISILSLYLIWSNSYQTESIKISFCLGLIVLGSFFINTILMNFYKGALSEKNGVSKILNIDANVLAFTFEIILLLIGFLLTVYC